MHILRSVCLSQRIIRTHPSHSRHTCVTEWVSASAVVLILGVLMGTSLRYIEISHFCNFNQRHQASESIALCVQGTLQDLLEAIELQIFEYVR